MLTKIKTGVLMKLETRFANRFVSIHIRIYLHTLIRFLNLVYDSGFRFVISLKLFIICEMYHDAEY